MELYALNTLFGLKVLQQRRLDPHPMLAGRMSSGTTTYLSGSPLLRRTQVGKAYLCIGKR